MTVAGPAVHAAVATGAATVRVNAGELWHAAWTRAAAVLVIVVVTVVARWLLHRLIDRTVRSLRKGAERAVRIRPALPGLAAGTADDVEEVNRRDQRSQAIASVLKSVATFWVYGLAAVYILHAFGVNLTPIIASAGVVGIAVGFGAQTLVKDFLSGVFMILEDQYGVGDTIDVGTARGTVEKMTLRVTQVRDVNGVLWHIRNGSIDRVGNTSQGWSQAVVDIPVAHDDVARAGEAIEHAARSMREDPEWADVIVDDAEVLGVQELLSDRVVVQATVRTAPERRAAVARELRARVAGEFDRLDIRVSSPPRPADPGAADPGAADPGAADPGPDAGAADAGASPGGGRPARPGPADDVEG